MLIFLDFDYTLLDTNKYCDLLFAAGAKAVYDEKKQRRLELPRETRMEITRTADFRSFLYEDTVPFLERWKGKAELILITFGDKEVQSTKVERSGIKDYFNEVIYTEQVRKAPFIASKSGCLEDACAFFLDDRPEEVELAAETCPHLHTVRMKRPGGEHNDEPAKGFTEVSDLTAFEGLLRCEV